MQIKELTHEQINRIIQSLEEDGFKNVKLNSDTYITYSKGPRDFELYTIDMNGGFHNDDNFVNIHFREEEYFNSMKDVTESTKFVGAKKMNLESSFEEPTSKKMDFENHRKTRHTSSINQKSENEVEDAIDSLGAWELIHTYDLKINPENEIHTLASSTTLLHLDIKGKPHFALNHGPANDFVVYEGHPDLVLSILSEKPEDVVLTPSFVKTITDIKLESND